MLSPLVVAADQREACMGAQPLGHRAEIIDADECGCHP